MFLCWVLSCWVSLRRVCYCLCFTPVEMINTRNFKGCGDSSIHLKKISYFFISKICREIFEEIGCVFTWLVKNYYFITFFLIYLFLNWHSQIILKKNYIKCFLRKSKKKLTNFHHIGLRIFERTYFKNVLLIRAQEYYLIFYS